MTTLVVRRRREIERLVASDFARDRLARALFDIVANGLDLGPVALRTQADRAWVRTAIAGPIRHAAGDAIDRLVADLVETLALGSPEVIGRMLGDAPGIRREHSPLSGSAARP